jgi:hypothetical protein
MAKNESVPNSGAASGFGHAPAARQMSSALPSNYVGKAVTVPPSAGVPGAERLGHAPATRQMSSAPPSNYAGKAVTVPPSAGAGSGASTLGNVAFIARAN